jgi:predicted nucleotidyltransferase
MDYSRLIELFRALDREGVRYALIGAVALGVLGLPRATQDVDLFIEPSSENIDRLKRALQAVFQDPKVDEIAAEDLLGDYAVVRYFPESADFGIDLVTRIGDAFRFEDLETQRGEFEGVPVVAVSAKTLWNMKRHTLRLQDRADAARIAERFGLKEE